MTTVTAKLLRGTINGVPGEYTTRGWMLDYGDCSARAVIIDTEGIGAELRKLRIGDRIALKLAIEVDGQESRIEYEGPAEVQMVRFRASRTEMPHFRTQFKLLGWLWPNSFRYALRWFERVLN
jgi:hypothetical protein